MKHYQAFAGLFLAASLILLLVSACPQKAPGGSGHPAKRFSRGSEQAKPVTVADIDVAGTEVDSLKSIASKVLDKDGAFIAAERLTPKEWGKLKTQLGEEIKGKPLPFAYFLLAGVNNTLSAGNDEAIAAAREAVKLAPESAWANDLLGHVLSLGGRDDEAKLVFEKVRKLAGSGVPPPYITVLSGGRDDEVMGSGGRDDEVAKGGGRDDEVAKGGGRDDEVVDSKLAGELGTGGPMRYANYAPELKLSLETGGDAKFKAATLGLKGAEDAELTDIAAKLLTPQGYFYRDAAIAKDDWKAMVDKLGAKAEAGENALAAWLYAGAMLVQKDEVESPTLKKAIAQADKAANLAPESSRALYMRGVTLALSGASDKAIKVLAKAAKLDPAYAAPRLALADIYARLGNNDMAKAELDIVAKMRNASKAEKAAAEAKKKALAAK